MRKRRFRGQNLGCDSELATGLIPPLQSEVWNGSPIASEFNPKFQFARLAVRSRSTCHRQARTGRKWFAFPRHALKRQTDGAI